jgi:hypothetical protein
MVSVHNQPDYADVRKKMERVYHELRAQYGMTRDGPGGGGLTEK